MCYAWQLLKSHIWDEVRIETLFKSRTWDHSTKIIFYKKIHDTGCYLIIHLTIFTAVIPIIPQEKINITAVPHTHIIQFYSSHFNSNWSAKQTQQKSLWSYRIADFCAGNTVGEGLLYYITRQRADCFAHTNYTNVLNISQGARVHYVRVETRQGTGGALFQRVCEQGCKPLTTARPR